MQPQRLRLKHFGPFIDETVNFSDLTDAPLFLISGKTGAGKTTIFDGMTYALFGETSGRLRTGKEMRSLFATPEEETSVTFLFKHQQFIYEITRKPEQVLAKRKGIGMKKQAAKVSLTIFDQEGKEKQQFTKKNDIDQLITELLHLDAKQFSQIVLLPQGEFRNFLISPSKEKEIILRHLFGTQIFQQFNERLKEQTKQKQKELNYLDQELALLQQRFSIAEERVVETMGIAETLQFWQQEQESLSDEINREKQQATELQKQQKQLEMLYYQGKAQNAQLEEKHILLAKQEQLEQKREEAEQAEQWLEYYAFAQKQIADIQYWQTYREEHRILQRKQKEQALFLAKKTQELDRWQAAEPEREILHQKIVHQTNRLQYLQGLLPLVKEKQARQQELAEVEEQLRQIEQEKEQQQAQHFMLQEEQIAMNATLAQAETLQADQLIYAQLQYQKHEWEIEKQWLEKTEKELVASRKNLQKHQKALVKEQEKLTLQVEKVKHLKSEWVKHQIAKLQLLLVPGEPCPVCGALEHPKVEHKLMATADIKQLEVQLGTAESKQEQLIQSVGEMTAYLQKMKQEQAEKQQNLTQHQNDLSKKERTLKEQIQIAFSMEVAAVVPAFEQIESSLSRRKQELEEAQGQEQKVTRAITALDEKINKTTQKALKITEQQQRILGKLDTLAQQLESVETELLECEIRSLEIDITAKEKEYEGWVAKGEELRQSVQLYQNNQENLITQEIELRQKIKQLETKLNMALAEQSYFKEFTEILAFVKTEEQYQQNQEILRTYQEERLINSSRLVQLKEISTNGELIDLTSLEAEKEQVTKKLEECQETIVKKQERQSANQQVFAEFRQRYEKSQKQLAELSELQQLSQVMNGENNQKISLERYVLQVYLMEVLQTANEHLQQLTKHRYQFELAAEIGSYRGNTGLEIHVYDDEAGMTRSAHTLSGGESFIAALSLALALAEVIQTQAGGVAIEALFIDEGFGSLDEEALEMAIEALETIESQGRMIGIISHVRELKERIPQQIRIKTEGSGQSKICYHLG